MFQYRNKIAAITSLALFSISSLGIAQESIRCGTELIKSGDTAEKLLKFCGKPISDNARVTGFQEWTYDFGAERFKVKVTLARGEVVRFDRMGDDFIESTDDVLDSTK